MYKQTSLANIHHTCTCPDDSVVFDWKSTKVIDVDFEQPNKEADNARILWVLSTCKRCKGKVLHGSSYTDYRTRGERLLSDAQKHAENWISSQRRFFSIPHEPGCYDEPIQRIWNRHLHQPSFTFLLASNEHGFADYEITGDETVKRICVAHGIKKGDIVNVYRHNGSKQGAVWYGSVEKTLDVFIAKESMKQHEAEIEYFPSSLIEEIGSIRMQDIMGEYESPELVPEWQWVEKNACFVHAKNGQSGLWEFVLNMACHFDDIPPKLKPALTEALQRNLHYVIVHNGT